MATPIPRSRGALVLVSVLVGVAIAVGSHLLWIQPDSGDATSAAGPGASLHRDDPGGPTPGGGFAEPTTESTADPEPATSSVSTPGDVPTTTPVEPADSTSAAPTTSDSPTPTTTSAPATSGPGSDTGEPSSPSPTTTTSAEPDEDPLAELLRYVNEERIAAGCEAAATDPALDDAAQAHSSDMADNRRLSHSSSDGTSFEERVEDHGYDDPAAENLAMGVTSARAVVDNWMAQPAHNANITDCDVAAMGAGLDEDGWYWTLDLGY